MKLKGWGLPPFLPTTSGIGNASSRKLKPQVANPLPRYALEADHAVVFQMGFAEVDKTEWITFTNTGWKNLTNLKAQIRSPFIVEGGTPSLLRPGESFKIRVKFSPKEPDIYRLPLLISADESEFSFLVQGSWDYAGLLYNGTARHNGKYYYGGYAWRYRDTYFDGQLFFDGTFYFDGQTQ